MTPLLALLALSALCAAALPFPSSRDALRRVRSSRTAARDARVAFPAFVDALAAALASGLSLQLALAEVAPTLPATLGPTARRAAASLALGLPVGRSLEALAEVVPAEDVAPLALVLTSFARSGGRVARSLERVSALLRGRIALEQEREALTAQSRASALVLVALAPLGAVFFSLAMPDYAATLLGEGMGLLLVALALEIAGGLWLWRIVRRTRGGSDIATFLDAVVVGLEAGLTFERSLAGIVDRAPDPPRAADARRLLADLRLGSSLSSALRAFARGPAESRVAALVSVSSRVGSPLAHLLVVQAEALRESERRRAESAARRLPVLMLFPLALCVLPALLVVFLGPPLLTLLR